VREIITLPNLLLLASFIPYSLTLLIGWVVWCRSPLGRKIYLEAKAYQEAKRQGPVKNRGGCPTWLSTGISLTVSLACGVIGNYWGGRRESAWMGYIGTITVGGMFLLVWAYDLNTRISKWISRRNSPSCKPEPQSEEADV
jgi:hypothetical protein